jgi:Family of unknown function (DUF6297)
MTSTVGTIPNGAPRVAAVRSYIRSRRHRRWFDWYSVGFTLVLAVILFSDVLADPFRRLTATSGGSAPAQAVAGAALVIGAAAGVVALMQAFGPLALSPADASWLLLSPLDRRGVLRRPAATAAGLAALAGGVLGALALAMAGPFVRHGAHGVPWAGLVLAAVGGAGFVLAAVLAAVLAQPREDRRAWLRGVCAVVAAVAAAGALTGQRWTAVSRAVTTGWADLSDQSAGGSAGAPVAAAVTAAAVVAAGGVALVVWRTLPRFPAGVLRSGSARAGRIVLAATFGNLALLSWITEDSHWRGRLLPSRSWPQMPPALVLAWADWRRLGRRPATLAVLAGSTLAPALAGAAVAAGQARGLVTAAVLLAGGIAAGVQGTAATRRDTNDPALSRLLGVRPGAALAARAALPALLAAAWLTLALVLLVFAGVLSGWWWPLLGLVAGPGLAAAALRIARTVPIDPGEKAPETALGPTPPWLVTRAISVLVGLAGSYPLLKAVRAGHVHGGTFAAQVAVSAVVLGGYLVLAASYGRGTRGPA